MQDSPRRKPGRDAGRHEAHVSREFSSLRSICWTITGLPGLFGRLRSWRNELSWMYTGILSFLSASLLTRIMQGLDFTMGFWISCLCHLVMPLWIALPGLRYQASPVPGGRRYSRSCG